MVIKGMNSTLTEANFNDLFDRLISFMDSLNQRDFTYDFEQDYATSYNYIVGRIREAGYCPLALCQPLMTKYGITMISDKIPGSKEVIDSDFSIDMSDHEEALAYIYVDQWAI